ncbi:hypothetical protein FQA39_LY05537 [Lamprigera yunnana]|nr:hypothetical protein FQA39_LY05537 [Lamprigera yunnana]
MRSNGGVELMRSGGGDDVAWMSIGGVDSVAMMRVSFSKRGFIRVGKEMGIKLGCTVPYTLQSADDEMLLVKDRNDVSYMARKLQQEYKELGQTNTDKTKYLPIVVNPTDVRLEDNSVWARTWSLIEDNKRIEAVE